MAASPPAEGEMLLLPLHDGVAASLPIALDHGALIVSVGPMPNSLVVRGARRELMPALLRSGVLVLAAPRSACGARGGPRA